jgi:hypothetical protein
MAVMFVVSWHLIPTATSLLSTEIVGRNAVYLFVSLKSCFDKITICVYQYSDLLHPHEHGETCIRKFEVDAVI